MSNFNMSRCYLGSGNLISTTCKKTNQKSFHSVVNSEIKNLKNSTIALHDGFLSEEKPIKRDQRITIDKDQKNLMQ